jgi:hypothetical protein
MGEMSDISDNVAIERMEDIYRKYENKSSPLPTVLKGKS